MMIRSHGCFGLKLFRWKRKQLELWFCPGGTVIPDHVHKQIEVEMLIVAGCMNGRIGDRRGPVGWRDLLRRFYIPSGTVHGATVTGRFCLFASLETWKKGSAVTSAALDFTEV